MYKKLLLHYTGQALNSSVKYANIIFYNEKTAGKETTKNKKHTILTQQLPQTKPNK